MVCASESVLCVCCVHTSCCRAEKLCVSRAHRRGMRCDLAQLCDPVFLKERNLEVCVCVQCVTLLSDFCDGWCRAEKLLCRKANRCRRDQGLPAGGTRMCTGRRPEEGRSKVPAC